MSYPISRSGAGGIYRDAGWYFELGAVAEARAVENRLRVVGVGTLSVGPKKI